MADDRDARIAQLEAENAALREREALLVGQVEQRDRALADIHEQQTATADVLRVIASTHSDLLTPLEEIARAAGRLVGGLGGNLLLWDGEYLRTAVSWGLAQVRVGEIHAMSERRIPVRAFLERRTITIADRTDPAVQVEYPDMQYFSAHTSVTVPLVRDGVGLGVFELGRETARQFTAHEVALLNMFADQAVIAIENARLFEELERRNADLQESNRRVTEALEQQTVMGEVLRVIATPPTDLAIVLDTIAEHAARVCGANDAIIHQVDEGGYLRRVTHVGPVYVGRSSNQVPGGQINRDWPPGRAIVDRRTIHVEDLAVAVETEFPAAKETQRRDGVRTLLVTPLLRDGAPIGDILIRRAEVKPFTERQIALLETFADQAVIAIENARLFEELERRNDDLQASNRQVTEALEQQTATAEVLRVIASSPTDAEAVFRPSWMPLRDCATLPAVPSPRSEHAMVVSCHGCSRARCRHGRAPTAPHSTPFPVPH